MTDLDLFESPPKRGTDYLGQVMDRNRDIPLGLGA